MYGAPMLDTLTRLQNGPKMAEINVDYSAQQNSQFGIFDGVAMDGDILAPGLCMKTIVIFAYCFKKIVLL